METQSPGEPPVTVAEMETTLLATVEVSDQDLQHLMMARAKRVQSFLLGEGKISPDRLFVIEPRPEATPSPRQRRVTLSLN